jgi:hypothetical protein
MDILVANTLEPITVTKKLIIPRSIRDKITIASVYSTAFCLIDIEVAS